MSTAKPLLALTLGVGLMLPAASWACGTEPYLGTICTFGFNFCPRGYLPAQGQLLPISQYTALFSLYGTTYGGNGQTNFALPDLRGRAAVGAGQGPGLDGIVLGQTGGAQQVTLNQGQLPSHTHSATTNVSVTSTLKGSSGPGNNTSPAGNILATSSTRDTLYSNAAPNANLSANAVANSASATTAIGAAGSNQPVPTLPPYLGLTYCVATEGIFPSRP